MQERLKERLNNCGVFTPDDWADLINDWAASKGWNNPNRTQDEWAALAHTEISEAYEEYRNHLAPNVVYFNEGSEKPEGMCIEYADLLIRVFHWFAAHDICIEDVLKQKMSYNFERPYRHGGKRA